jgi:3',5'-cyclic AMP phosphodiesterase CpdA
VFRLAHISDLRLATVPRATLAELANKRALSFLSWHVRKRRQHLAAILKALVRDLEATAPDHLAITGDLVNLALPAEFAAAGAWLGRLGPPERISVVPGNHDALVPVPLALGWDHWRAHMSCDGESPELPVAGFPYLRRRGPLALVGLSTATPTAPGRATGLLGAVQLEHLGRLLGRLAGTGWCRVLLMHHSPVDGASRPRRRLIDAGALRSAIAAHGADLVLHGHEHAFRFDQIAGRERPVPVLGVPSASKQASAAADGAQYCIYTLAPGDDGWRIVVERRLFAGASRGFVPGPRHLVARANGRLSLEPEPGPGSCRRSA